MRSDHAVRVIQAKNEATVSEKFNVKFQDCSEERKV